MSSDDATLVLARAIERLAAAIEGRTTIQTMPSVAGAVFDAKPAMLHDLPPDEVAPIPGAFPPDPRAAAAPIAPPPPQNIAPQGWYVGAVHTAGHKPLKANRTGLYCPTKLQDGSWCPWKPAAA